MALTVEDGTGKTDAESYVSVLDCQTYFTEFGYTETPSEATMRRSAQWMDARYLNAWKGTKTTSTQALQWPRDSMTDEDGNDVDSDVIPQAVIDAQCEVSRVVGTDMVVDSSKTIRSVKAGSVAVEFAIGSHEGELLDFITARLAPYLKDTHRVVRGA